MATESDSAADSAASTVSTTRSHTPHQKFMFDMGASSHMTSDIGRFYTFRSVHGVVEIANGQFIDYAGKGTVLLNCVLPDGIASPVRLNDVLFVPTLSRSLFSWPAARRMGFCMEDHNDGHGIVLKRKDGSVVLCTETVKSMDFIKEELPSQLSNAVVPTSFVSLPTHDSSMPTSTPTYTFEHWHAAFGHV